MMLGWSSVAGSSACFFFITLMAFPHMTEEPLFLIPFFICAYSFRFYLPANEESVSPNVTRVWGVLIAILTGMTTVSDIVIKGWIHMRYDWAKLPLGLLIAWSLFDNAKRREQANEQRIAYQQMLDRQNGPPC